MHNTNFTMVKGDREYDTTDLEVVERLQALGWKVLQSDLGELL